MTDLLNITPQVNGYIDKIYIKDNQYVKKNTLLLEIEKTPYELAVEQKQAALNQAKEDEELLTIRLQRVAATLNAEKAKLNLANITLGRYQGIYQTNTKAISRQDLDDAIANQLIASANLTKEKVTLLEIQQALVVQKAKIKKAESELHTAQYYLSLTKIFAPVEGYINNLRVYQGDYVTTGAALFGMASAKEWRIIANYKEYALNNIYPGQKVLVYIYGYGLRIFIGEVISVGRAVARKPYPENSALPYIEPITDWIRYPYRFPVRIHLLNLPNDIQLHMGADVRTILLP